MDLRNFHLRLRISEVESHLSQIEDTRRVDNSGLKQRQQRRLLEEKKSIRGTLDVIIYLILSILVEITSEIFLYCLPDKPLNREASEDFYPCPAASYSTLFVDFWGRLTTFRGDSFTLQECMELLQRTTKLVRCEFHDIEDLYFQSPQFCTASPS
ncbi:hypothetical protein DFH07DRAFT_1018268 [Mycena maculata]|uniref:Uncharacterized protein n=1 Tax=Mycena maculata TaxID=230809 RepID=A0AAD7JHM4_9AGAR|nr:hypothetical protein DFH07DRAFT_1018268 [Mycena maculata]